MLRRKKGRLSTDVGSLPPRVDVKILDEGAIHTQSSSPLLYDSPSSEIFEQEVVDAFVDKIKSGVSLPTYTQFRDMYKMFMDLALTPNLMIPEVFVLQRNLSEIKDRVGLDTIPVRICMTGTYSLSSRINGDKAATITNLTESLCKILEHSLFKSKFGEVKQVCIDEPSVGFLNDPFLDYGWHGRDVLRKSWEDICKVASSRGVETGIHLHDTSDPLFWEVEHLNIIESHVGDSVYYLKSTRKNLEEKDKFLKASVAVTSFNNLIMEKVGSEEKYAESWEDINAGKVNPETFLEDEFTMKKRLTKIVDQFGIERVPYSGPECGLNGFPTYDCAMKYLQRVSKVVLNN